MSLIQTIASTINSRFATEFIYCPIVGSSFRLVERKNPSVWSNLMIDTECVIIEFDHAKKSYCDMFPFMANEAKISQRCDYIILAVFKDNLFVICIELKTKTEREFKMQLVRGHHFGHYLLSSAYTLVKDSERPRQITLRSLLLKELTGNQQKDTTRIHPDVPYNEPLGPDGKYGRFGYENLGTPLTLSSLCR